MRISKIKACLILAIGLTVLFIAPATIRAQNAGRQFVNVTVIIKAEQYAHGWKVPVMTAGEISPFTDGGQATVDCLDCPLTSEMDFAAFAENTTGNNVKISVTLRFTNSKACNVESKVFIINKSKKRTVKLGCGIKIETNFLPSASPPLTAN